ncbi:MAG: TIGR00282 family metallophosphoesterase [Oscillospiraceae bacterium]
MNILAIGDVVGEVGVHALERRLREIKRENNVDFTVVNGENSAGVGVTPSLAHRIYNAGADVITLGNHVWGKKEIVNFIEDDGYILRPANLADVAPGRGHGIFQVKGKMICVINLQGRCGMDFGPDNPFTCVSRILKETARLSDFAVVDFHANATSEKIAMGYNLDGKVSAVWGTHTHVQTADERVLPNGTGYITDLGMTGPIDSVLGVRIEQSLKMFRGEVPVRFETAPGPCKVCGALFSLDDTSFKCTSVQRIQES